MANNSFSPKIGQDRLEPIIGVSHVSKQGKGSFFDRATREWCNHDFRQLRRKISILDESSEGEWTESELLSSDSVHSPSEDSSKILILRRNCRKS